MKNKHLFVRMAYAITGLRLAISREKSIRFQLLSALAVYVLLLILQPSVYWWAIATVVIAMVIAAEMFNTAIEAICDFVQPEKHESIKNIKDVAAGGVLLTSVGAVIVACIFLIDLIFF